jgi:hypothetical protein
MIAYCWKYALDRKGYLGLMFNIFHSSKIIWTYTQIYEIRINTENIYFTQIILNIGKQFDQSLGIPKVRLIFWMFRSSERQY